MARTPKALADGQLANSKGTIYTTPASTTTYITSITCHNTNATAQTIVWYVNRTGTSRVIARAANIAQYYTVSIDSGLILEAADLLEAETTTATAVDYQVSGIEET